MVDMCMLQALASPFFPLQKTTRPVTDHKYAVFFYFLFLSFIPPTTIILGTGIIDVPLKDNK